MENLPGIALGFRSADYASFVIMIVLSLLIGVYFGFYKKQDTVLEYLYGGQAMGIFPMAMSLIACNVSSITLLGVPSEMYMYGTQFVLVMMTVFPACLVTMFVFQPVFYKLKYLSTFEYLEDRFSREVRHLASLLFAISSLLFLPIIVYIPCLALNQVSGVSMHLVSPVVCTVCIFYTSLGGVKAVAWTDALQLVVLTFASFFVIGLGIVRVGGLEAVWSRATEGGRLELFNMDPSPYARGTFWSVGLGTFLMHLAQQATLPSSVQRYLCVPSLGAARWTVATFACGTMITESIGIGLGVVMYAAYHRCDPLHEGVRAVAKQDQLVPHYVMDVTAAWPGLAGLFIAGVFSAALSTMSAVINTLAGTIYKDFIETFITGQVSDSRAAFHMKVLSVIIGAFGVAMVFVVENLGGVLQVAFSLGGVTDGPLFGLFTMGMLLPWVNHKGAMAGAVSSLIFMTVVVAGNMHAMATDALHYPSLPTSVDGCLRNYSLSSGQNDQEIENTSSPATSSPLLKMPHDADVFPLFKLTYYYFSLVGTVVAVGVGLAVSFCTGPRRLEDCNPDLFSPFVSHFLSKHRRQSRPMDQGIALDEYDKVSSSDLTDDRL